MNDDIDDLASQYVDGLVTADEIPALNRSVVLDRASIFESQRQSLMRIDAPSADVPHIDWVVATYRRRRRQRFSLSVAAVAASFVVLSGLVITQVGSDESPDVMTRASDSETALTPYAAAQSVESGDMATSDANREIIDLQSIAEVRELSESIELPAEASAPAEAGQICVTDETQRLITRQARYQGTLVEIYRTSSGGLSVYSQTDCSLVLQLET